MTDPPDACMDEEDDSVSVTSCCGRRRAPVQQKTSTRDMLPMRGVSVTPCVKGGQRGSVRFTDSESAPVGVVWTHLPADAIVDRAGLTVTNLSAGRYTARVFHRDGASCSSQVISVPEIALPFVSSLRARPATAWPWNGVVTASAHNCPPDAIFVWSTGESTCSPVLRNARPGVYGVRVVDADTGSVLCTHAEVARVEECL
tara:strand:- start:1340 stop:1942 length:603 start_codon:yes stop_codon:yes gene_type:complete